MALPQFKLSWEGQEPTPVETLGLDVVSRVLVNQGTDTVTLASTLQGKGARDAQVIPSRAIVHVWKDGERIFQGTAFNPKNRGADKVDAQFIQIVGPWHWLENTGWRWKLYSPDPALDVPLDRSPSVLWSRLQEVINEDLAGYLTVPTTWGADLPQSTLGYVPLAPGGYGQNIRQFLAWYPSVCTRWDYSGAIPAMSLGARGFTERHIFELGSPPLAEIDLQDLSDRVPLAIKMRIHSRAGLTLSSEVATSLGNWYWTEDMPPAQRPGTVARPWEILTLYDLPFQFNVLLYADDTLGPQLASYIINELLAAKWQGTATLLDDGCRHGIRPGDTLAIVGSAQNFDNDPVQVQQVSENYLTGTTTLQLGLAGALSMDNMMLRFRQRTGWVRVGSGTRLPVSVL